ncbi:serine/threonine-protein phosphatase 6 regulatory subunit 3-A isoform X3 [Pieris brassicae]|uniref:serine/threonine-protein phosphatase 6 regulatory subunit 3-A isoform X3 n=1 Tax=Pieris brassicae TaxID=7116 RepID=UPI001E66100B|nr:serine/threonine-protein phosphatase 6 regulatory subunit 3-A isoform X3 [Pieris brassicae]
MFWSANYMTIRQLNFLLKEENVTLTQILEADDILQECKADNKDLIRFLTRPEILAELIALITEEPSKDLELTTQYRHSNIACEVLTSQLSGLMSSLCIDVKQMNRLCDFLNRDPPLNPLLASYFSRTIETLLKRSPMQDCYLHHILCLRALDFFKARKDFLPNLLRHIATSAIADTIKYFVFYLEEPFSEIIEKWLVENEFLENLIQIICCDYEPTEIQATPVPVPIEQKTENDVEKGVHEESEKAEASHKDSISSGDSSKNSAGMTERTRRLQVAASASASALACGLAGRWAGEDWQPSWTTRCLSARLRTKPLVNALLLGCFCSPPDFYDTALFNACRLLRVLIQPLEDTCDVELRDVTPHLRLLQQDLLREPATGPSGRRRVGAARLQVVALMAELMGTQEPMVHMVMRTLAMPDVLLDLFFAFPDNNFLHAQVCTMLHNISQNKSQAPVYWVQLVEEGNLLTRLMDTFEENEDKKTARRSSLMGHVTVACRTLAAAGVGSFALPEVQERWEAFLQARLQPLLTRLDAPLGGEYPSETWNEIEAGKEGVSQYPSTESYSDDLWENNPSNVLDFDEGMQMALDLPWERSSGWGDDEEKNEGEGGDSLPQPVPEDEGWAQFGSDTCLPPVDPFAPQDSHPWNQNVAESGEDNCNMSELQAELNQLQLDGTAELTHNLLSALSGLAPHHLAELADTASQLPPALPPTDPPISDVQTIIANVESTNDPKTEVQATLGNSDATSNSSNSDTNAVFTEEVASHITSVENPVSNSTFNDHQNDDKVFSEVNPNVSSVTKSDTKIISLVGKSDSQITNEVGKSDTQITNEVGKSDTQIINEIGKANDKLSDEVPNFVTEVSETNNSEIKVGSEVDESNTSSAFNTDLTAAER